MIRKNCRLERASRYYMGGGGGSPSYGSPYDQGGLNRNWATEQKDIGKGYQFQQDQFNQFVSNNPLLNAAQGGALSFWDQLPQMLSQFKGFGNELSGYQNQIGGYQNQLGGISNQLGGLYGKLGGQANRLGNWLTNQVQPTISSHGALTPEMARDVSQQTRAIASAQGNAHSLGALGNELLNRDAYREQRFSQALQQGQGLLGQQSGIFGQQAGIRGQQAGLAQAGAGLTAMNAGLTGQKSGLLGQLQALQTGGLNQMLGVGNAAVSQFGGLTNPILSYIQGIFGGNQQAQIQKAQIDAQAQAQSAASGKSTIGGIISAIGPILGAVMSDERVKTKIKDTGLKTEDNVPIKTFEYKTRPGVPFVGVMAQDLKKKLPSEVFVDPVSGVEMVTLPFSPIRVQRKGT